ncbi:2-oxoglutarate-Fe(II) type oxidoreductase hxnY-like protein [Drosera capensis]
MGLMQNRSSNLYCIDLSEADIHASVSLLKQACLDCGFFYVIKHGISQELMDEVFTQSKKFFSLPTDEKMKVLKNKISRGYTPLFDERLGPVDQVNGDYKEGYYIGVEIPGDDPKAQGPFCGPNVWPDADLLPGWRQTMQEYHRQALEVARTVARIIALALDLDANFFDKREMLGDPTATLRLLHYYGQVSDPSRGIYAAGAHSDFGLITLLATDDVPGLQICKNKDAEPQIWEDVAPLKGGSKFQDCILGGLRKLSLKVQTVRFGLHFTDFLAFIVNLGDMLERWSNCIFKSTLHRVIGNGQERYSVNLPPGFCRLLRFSWSQMLIALWNACPPASHKPILPSMLHFSYYYERTDIVSSDQLFILSEPTLQGNPCGPQYLQIALSGVAVGRDMKLIRRGQEQRAKAINRASCFR